MKFLEIFINKKFILLNIILSLYILLNLLDGQRGLISYLEKQKIKEHLILEKETLGNKISELKKKNDLLTNNVDLDYLEILYRKKFMMGKTSEKIIINKYQ